MKRKNPLFRRPGSPHIFARVWDPNAGRYVRRCTYTDDEAKALRVYEKLLADVQAKRITAPTPEQRMTLGDLKALVIEDYQANANRSEDRATFAFKHLETFFGAKAVTASLIARWPAYLRSRLDSGAAPSSVRYERSLLHRAFVLAHEEHLVSVVPAFKTPAVHNTRTGFVDRPLFDRIVAALPEDLQPPMRFAYLTAWRIQEVLGLQWRNVNFDDGTIRLEADQNKTKAVRTIPFDSIPELADLLRRQPKTAGWLDVTQQITPWVFPRGFRGRRTHWHSAPIKDYRAAWKTAVATAGVPGLLVHDLRRSAIRNMVRAGLPPHVAMSISGHRSLTTFTRYCISDPSMQRDALRRTGYGGDPALAPPAQGDVIAFPAAR